MTIHFFYSLIYLFLCTAITTCYVVVLYVSYAVFSRFIYKTRYKIAEQNWIAGQGNSPDKLRKSDLPYFPKKLFIRMAGLVLIFFIVIYVHQRWTWMGEENLNRKAKEYWVVGQVVYTPRMLLGRFLHPENLLLRPYVMLQKTIYSKGEKLLPPNDGERCVWKNSWFLYQYSRKSIRPYFVDSKKYSPKMVALLDNCWVTMECMATTNISDPEMREKYLLTFPFLVSYYSQYQGHYTGPYWMSGFKVRNNELYIARNYTMLEWLDKLYENWQKEGLIKTIWEKYPYVASFRQHDVNRLLHQLALSLPLSGDFSCDHPIMHRMYKEYQNAMSDDPTINSFLNLKKSDPRQASLAYQSAVYAPLGSAGNYLLEKVCGKKMPTEHNLIINRKIDPYYEFYEYDRVERVFSYELMQFTNDGEKNE